jgi:glycosyltransferase involved in cell wall biosynthesis
MRSSWLRVLSIAHNAVAGSNRARVDALRQLPGVEVSLLTPEWWFEEGRRVEVPSGAPWRVGSTLFTGNGTRHLYVRGLVEAVRATRPDVIDLYEEPFSLVALQTLLARDVFAPRAALVFYSAVNVARRWRWPYRGVERLVFKRADAAHTPNADVPPMLRARGLGADKPVHVIPLGVDGERFAAAAAADLGDCPRPRIGFVGRLEPVKGLDVLVSAYRLLGTRASLVVAGDGPERARLIGQGIYVMPPVPYDDLPGFLRALDMLVLPSVTILPLHREQFGRVLVEAMAAGVPVIGSSSGAIPEVIGDAGLVVPERDPAALAEAIARLLREPELSPVLIERGYRRVETRFAWPVVARQTLELFRAALAHRRGVATLEPVRV